ncbi:TldD/PmbA family protein [candidate division CSSED10-310 bacterium]|uniref:TldD/PmbA family protein n=1 Tax=candidate division CSSED10-310 bacterium TaxID=2855610 RepID=A0ABV6YZI1_UNCC1
MEKLLEQAKRVSEQAEVYESKVEEHSVTMENGKLQDIESKYLTIINLRIIKDGKLGFAYGCDFTQRQDLLHNALKFLYGGIEAPYKFPCSQALPEFNTYDPAIETINSRDMSAECDRIFDYLSSRTTAEINIYATTRSEKIRILNSHNTDLFDRSSSYTVDCEVVYPGSAASMWRTFSSKRFEEIPVPLTHELSQLYSLSVPVVQPSSDKMQILFMPNSLDTINWRIMNATNAESIYKKFSPLTNKLEQKIFDQQVTVYDDPNNDLYPRARAFDDEGVACAPLTIVENGILKNFYNNLFFAQKLDMPATGHGYKADQSRKPYPTLSHMHLKPGKKSFKALVAAIKRGIILEYAMGLHCGNIAHGDFSVGIGTGLFVENGIIVGRVKDAMVAGNIYETLNQVIHIEDRFHLGSQMPAILCDGVSVSIK